MTALPMPFALILAAPLTAVLAAPGYPSRPIRLVAPFAPGGGIGVSAGFIAQRLSDALGQTVVVDTRPDAGGNLGLGIAARAAADGYTLLVTHNAIAINPARPACQTEL